MMPWKVRAREGPLSFQTAGIEVAFWLPPLVAFGISFFTCMAGVSGAFLLLPFQVSVLGFTAPAVSATNQVYNAASIPAGVYRYWREGRMVWALTWVVVVGTLPGVVLGAVIRVNWLPDPARFKLFVAAVLAYIGARLLRDLVGRGVSGAAGPAEGAAHGDRTGRDAATGVPTDGSGVEAVRFTWTALRYTYQDHTYRVPVRSLVMLTFTVGLVGGVYGIGGGAIIAPFLLSFYELPVHTVAGPVLLATFITSVAGVAVYQMLAPFYPGLAVAPDLALGLLFGVGGMAGMYLGARAQKYVPARAIKGVLAVVLVATALRYAVGAWAGLG